MVVRKSDGELETFDSTKLKESLLKSSTSILVTNDILKKIEETFKFKKSHEITTDEIYEMAFKILKEKEKPSALRYSIKRSLLSLGPTGFPFEKFISEIFRNKGYETIVGPTLSGKCVEHEVDVVAADDENLILCEVKFHNDNHVKTDTKIALYIKARFDDLKETKIKIGKYNSLPTRGMIITNTRFTNNSIKYAKCVDLGMLSWDYPKKGNLHNLIDSTKVFPITILESLNNYQKEQLISEGIVSCNQLLEQKSTINEQINFSAVETEIEKLSIK